MIPTVIGAILADVDLFPSVLADVGDVEGGRRTVEARPPRIAQAQRKDFVGSRPPHERIVGGDVVVEPGIRRAIHIDTQDLAAQAVDVLPGVQRVAGAATVADQDVEIPIGPEAEPAALVIIEFRLVD